MIEENIIKIYNKILKKPNFSYLDVQKILKIKDLFFDLKNNNDISSDIELEFINNDVLFYEKIYDLLTEIDKRIIDNYLKSLPAEKYDFELMMNNKIKNQSSVSEISKIKIYVNKRNEFCKRINLNNYYEYICLKNNLNGNNIVIKKIRHFVKQNLSKIYAKFNLAHLNINFNNLYMCKLINFRDSLLDKEICNNIVIKNTNKSWSLKFYPYDNKYLILQRIKNTESDIINYAHEIGHIYHISGSIKDKMTEILYFNYGLSEFFSSMSEVVCVKFLGNKEIKKRHIQKILKIILSSLVLDEFIEIVYTKAVIDENELSYIWEDLNRSYGIKDFKDWKNVFISNINKEHILCYAIAYLCILGYYEEIDKMTLMNFLEDSKKMFIEDLYKKYFKNLIDECTYKKIFDYCKEWLN